jgi:hypothetical protein
MFQLLIVVMAILLTAGVVVAGINYVGFDAAKRYAQSQTVSAGFQAWERAGAAYRIANRLAPSGAEDLLPFLPGGSPKAPDGFSWSYGRDAEGAFVCLSGEAASEDDVAVLRRMGDPSFKGASVPPSAIRLGQVCGAVGAVEARAPFAVTYRLGG